MSRLTRKDLDAPPKTPLVESAATPDTSTHTLTPRKRTPPRKPDEIAELRRRAAATASRARAKVQMQLNLSVDVYKALVELAEQFHQPISAVARQCVEDGIRKYKDFSTPGLRPFGPPPLERVAPMIQANQSLIERVRQRAPLPAHRLPPQYRPPSVSPADQEEMEEDAALTAAAEALASSNIPLEALLPSMVPGAPVPGKMNQDAEPPEADVAE